MKRAVIPPPGLFGFFLCLAGDSFVWGISLGTLFGMFSKTYGFSDAQLGVMTSAMSVSMVVSQLPVGRLVDRYGCKPSMVISEAIGLPLMLLWAFSSRLEVLVASYALFGLVGSTWIPAVMTYLAARIPTDERAEAIGTALGVSRAARVSCAVHRQFAVRAGRVAVAGPGDAGRHHRRDDGYHRAGQGTQGRLTLGLEHYCSFRPS